MERAAGAEKDRIIAELRDENKFLRLPQSARRRHRDQRERINQRERQQKIDELKIDLKSKLRGNSNKI